jgi:hypothetical protein
VRQNYFVDIPRMLAGATHDKLQFVGHARSTHPASFLSLPFDDFSKHSREQ